MGCDIHGWIEKRTSTARNKDKYVAVAELYHNGRNYRRFAMLASVRGEGLAPRGVPLNISDTTNYHLTNWGSDAHSVSYMALTQAAEIFARTQHVQDGDDTLQGTCQMSHFFNIYPEEDQVEDYRLVFWFDN